MTRRRSMRRRWIGRAVLLIGVLVATIGPMALAGMRPRWLLLGLVMTALAMVIWTVVDIGEVVTFAQARPPVVIERHPADDRRVGQLVSLIAAARRHPERADALRRSLVSLGAEPDLRSHAGTMDAAALERVVSALEQR